MRNAHGLEPRLLAGHELEAAFRLRYGEFVLKRGWASAHPDGLERDPYDACALHLAAVDEGGIAAYLRVLPYPAPFMLDREFACLAEGASLPRQGACELSRLCVRHDKETGKSPLGHHAVEVLLLALYREALGRGLTQFYAVVEPTWLLAFRRRFGLGLEAVGPAHAFPDGCHAVVAGACLGALQQSVSSRDPALRAWYETRGRQVPHHQP